jgi:hypothetical protein
VSWWIREAYATWNRELEALMARAAKPYVLLRPPASSIPLLVVADQLPPDDMRGEYEAWRQSASVIEADALTPHVEEELANYAGFPDVDETLELKWIATAARTPVALYAMETFGGVTESEWAWLFDGAGSDRVLVHQRRRRDVVRMERGWFRYKPVTTWAYEHFVVEVSAAGVVERPAGSAGVLREVAEHFGTWAPDGYFAPHTRGFNWGAYRVPPLAPDGNVPRS